MTTMNVNLWLTTSDLPLNSFQTDLEKCWHLFTGMTIKRSMGSLTILSPVILMYVPLSGIYDLI